VSTDKYILSSKLRPAVEFYTAVVCACCVYVCLQAPWMVALSPSIGIVAAGGFAVFGLVRAKQGWDVIHYQRNLRRLSRFEMTSRQIPISHKYLWLGKGFQWTRIHTQRLTDATDPVVAKYVEPGALYQVARSMEKSLENNFLLGWLPKLTSIDSPLNPVRPLPPVGGSTLLHGVEPDEVDVTLPLGDRVGHTIVFGTTRVGKTRLCEVYVTQDIHRGDVVIVFDPKGDADLLKRIYFEAKRAKRDKEFYVFHLGYPDLSARYNAIGRFSRLTEVPTRVAGQLSGEGNSAAFKQFAWRFVNIISRALVSLGQRPDYTLISRHVINIDALFVDYAKSLFASKYPNAWDRVAAIEGTINDKNIPLNMRGREKRVIAIEQYVAEARIHDDVLDGLRSAVRYDRTYFDKIVASLLPLLEKLTTGKAAQLLAPDYTDMSDSRPIFDWMQVMRKRGIVYVGLDALADSDVAAAVGNSMFADLVSVAGHVYKFGIEGDLPGSDEKKVPINIHADEFNELMGDEFVPLVNKGGGAGYQVTAYTQTLSDIEARISSKAKAGQVIGNFNTLQMLRVREPASAELLTKQLPKVNILTKTLVSGATDSADPHAPTDFTSSSQDRISTTSVPMIEPAHIVKLPKGQMFSLQEGGNLWKVRMPLPKMDPDDDLPSNLQELAAQMRKDYRSEGAWWATSSGLATSLDALREAVPDVQYRDTEVMGEGEFEGSDFDDFDESETQGDNPNDFEAADASTTDDEDM
jgi:conjugative coupling factor TraD (TOL family)